MNEKELKSLNIYLKAKIGVDCDQIKGHQSILKKDLVAITTLTLEDYPIMSNYPLKIKKGAKVKILDFVAIEPLGYSNYLFIEIVDSPIEINGIRVVLEKLVEAIK